MPLQSSGIIVVEKPNSASTCVSQHQQQQQQQQQHLLHATNSGNTTVATKQKPITEIQYYEYYDANDAHQQQQQSSQSLQQQNHAVVVDNSNNNGSTQQQQLMRRQHQQQRGNSAANIQQFNIKQQMNQQHIIQHSQHQQQQQHVVQQQQQQQPTQQLIQVSEELYEQAAAAGGNVMISTTGEMLNQQIFKIVTADGTTGNMIIDSMGNVTTTSGGAGGGGIPSATSVTNVAGNSKVLLSNLTVLSKPSPVNAVSTTAAGQQQQHQQSQQQQQTINFVSTKNLGYNAGTTTTTATNGKQQKLTSAGGGTSYKTSSVKQQQQQMMNNTTTTYIQQPAQQQQQQIVQKLTVPRNVQMVARVQTLMPQQQQQQQMILHQPQPQKYVVPTAGGNNNNNSSSNNIANNAKAGNVLKKSGSMKMSQHKMLNNANMQQGGGGSNVKTFIQQQQQQNSNQQQQQYQHHTTNKVKSQKIIKQYNHAINNSTGAVTIATLPQQQQQQQQSTLGTYTINQKLNNHQQTSSSSTKITKLSNNKYIMQNNQQQHHIMSAATLPQSTQIHHKSNHLSSNSSSNIVLQQQQLLTNTNSSSNAAGTIKFVNAHGTVIQQHHQQQQPTTTTITQKSRYQQQQHQQYTQQLQFVEAPVAAAEHGNSNIYQLSTQQQQQQQQTSVSSQQSLMPDEIMIVNGTQMTDEISARILQSMAQKSFGNQQRYQNQQQHHQQQPIKSSSTNMPPPQQIVLQQHHATTNASGGGGSGATSNILLSPKEYPIYNPVQHQQQQQQHQYVQHSNYLPTSPATSCTNVRQSHSAPGSRSQSIERKLHETSITKKSSDYFKVNNSHSNLLATSTTTRVANVPGVGGIISSLDAQSSPQSFQLQQSLKSSTSGGVTSSSSLHIAVAGSGGNYSASNANDDDIIGEEVRPVPVNTQDLRLQILHAVLQDHTYANAAPTLQIVPVTTTTQVGAINTNTLTVGGISAASVQSTSVQQLTQTQTIPAQQWSLGGIGATVGQAVAAAQVAHGTGPAVVTSLSSAVNVQAIITAGGTATSYTLYGQQIPRLQQDDDANSAISNGSRVAVGDIDPGEETETAAEAEDDSVTRCICDLTHDDGYMICCDKCSAWQHVDCMVIDRQNIPDEYLCELCQPRVVDKARARTLQLMKRKEQQTQILLNAQVNAATAGTASGNGAGNTQHLSTNELFVQQQQQRLVASGGGNLLLPSGVGGDVNSLRSTGTLNAAGLGNNGVGHGGLNTLLNANNVGVGGNTTKKGKVLKKTKEGGVNKKTKKAEKLAAAAAAAGGGTITKSTRKETKKNTKRKTKGADGSTSTAAEKHAANLRQWIENYELAVTNHYSPELRARLHAISKQPNLLQSITNTENKALKDCGNLETKATTVPHAGGKILISNLDIVPNCPIFELRGKYMLTTQYKTQNSSINMNTPPPSNYLSSFKAHKIPGPFIFFYQLPGAEVLNTTPPTLTHTVGIDGQLHQLPLTAVAAAHLKGPEICVDTRTYGNEARFVRRSCRPNAEIQHLFEKGTIHLFIVSLTDIRASTEITIRHEPHDLLAIENKKSSNLVIQPTSTACACGLTKDCLFGPTSLHQLPMAAAALPKVNRKTAAAAAAAAAAATSITLNGSSAALQLTMMGGFGGAGSSPMMGAKKKSQSQLNRNRSTSSSGDSNMGLNSPNIALMNLNNSANMSFKNLNMLSVNNGGGGASAAMCSSTIVSAAVGGGVLHDSGICTSSSSPSVSIPSPSSHVHSPTQQQQQQQLPLPLQALQSNNQTFVQQQHTLIVQQQQQQQHQQILAALPTPMLLSPQMQQQLQQQQQQQQQQQLSAAPVQHQQAPMPSSSLNSAISPALPKQTQQLPQQQYVEVDKEQQQQTQSAAPTTIYMQIPTQAAAANSTEAAFVNETLLSPTTLNLQQFTTLASANKNSSNTGSLPMTSPTSIDNVMDLQEPQQPNVGVATLVVEPQSNNFEQPQQQLPQQQQHQQPLITSPMKSPQKQQLSNTLVKKQKQLRTSSISETDAAIAAASVEQHAVDNSGDTNHATSPTSSTATATSHSNAKTSTPKEKPKLSREDRKMEAILRAIEKMEKNQQRKQELKQSKSGAGGLSSKRRNSNSNSPSSPNKRSASLNNSSSNTDTPNTTDGATPNNSFNNNNSLQQKKHPNFAASRKKKRKSHKSYNMHSTQRKRRKSRMNSNESDADAAVTSESETTPMLSPTLQTTTAAAGNNITTVATVVSSTTVHSEQQQQQSHATSYNNSEAAAATVGGSNVDQAAGLLMAFANPKTTTPESSCTAQLNYDMLDGFKSPNHRLSGTSNDLRAASPPPTPPTPVSSVCLLIEAAVGPLEAVENSVEFKYPCKTKTKKQLMSNWLNQSDVGTPTTTAVTAATADTQAMGLDTLVQAAMSDYNVQQQQESESPSNCSQAAEIAAVVAPPPPVQNFSIAAKKVEEFLQQTEQLANSDQLSSTYSNTMLENYQHTTPSPIHSPLEYCLTPSSNVAVANVPTTTTAVRNLHLPLQVVSTCSNNSSVKKRWLRQAISEEIETDENSTTPLSSASGTPSLLTAAASPTAQFNAALAAQLSTTTPIVPNGFTTPLKKRRLIISGAGGANNIKQEQVEENVNVSFTPPPPPLDAAASEIKLEICAEEPKLETKTENEAEADGVNTTVAGYDDVDVNRGAGGDDESEIVDVGNNEHHHTECHMEKENKTMPEIVIKHELEQTSLQATEGVALTDIKTEPKPEHETTDVTMDQDDDVDILRSPSPGHEKMVAEDNLVKIEPEDVSGGDDVKIDVEREESMAADKFEDYLQAQEIKKEQQQDAASNAKAELQEDMLTKAAVGVSTPVKLETKAEPIIATDVADTKAAKQEIKFDVKSQPNTFEDKLQIQLPLQLKNSFTKIDEPARKKLKLEISSSSTQQTSLLKPKPTTTSTEPAKNAISLLVAATTAVLPPPPAATAATLATTDASNSKAVDIVDSSVSTTTSSNTSSCCKIASADSTSSSINSTSTRKNLTDDDIQERLLSFHKQNILFLQTRNKKSKSNSTSSSATSPVATPLKSETDKESTKSHSAKKSSSSQNLSSKKLSKKERSSAGSLNISSREKNKTNANVCSSSTSSAHTHSSISSSKKQKTLKKSHSVPNATTINSSDNCNLLGNIVAAAVSSTGEKEKNRHRSISTSSTSSNTSITTKKRQLNFGEELSKDMLLINSSNNSNTGAGNKLRKDDKDINNFLSNKKRRESSCGVENRNSSKHKLNVNDTRKINCPTAATSDHATITPNKSVTDSTTKTANETTSNCNMIRTTTPPSLKAATTTTTAATTVATATVASSSNLNTTATVNSLPYYNTIYGKLNMDTTKQNQQQPLSSCNISATTAALTTTITAATTFPIQTLAPTVSLAMAAPQPVPAPMLTLIESSSNCIPVTPISSVAAAGSTTDVSSILTHSSSSSNSIMLSEYQDTKVKSYNSLGGYVSHTAMFGLNVNKTSSNVVAELHAAATTVNSPELLLSSPAVTPTTVCPLSATKLPSSALKILTKTASHDPRLNPILTAPEPPPAPKRKLSINEYRKRKQQSTDNTSTLSTTPTTETVLAPTLKLSTTTSKTIFSSNYCAATAANRDGGSPKNSTSSTYVPTTINKCTLNSPDRSFETIKDMHEKSSSSSASSSSLNDSLNSSNKSLSYLNNDIPSCLRLREDDNSKVQFSAAPTLLEKQQENLCERLKSLKRLSAISNDFGVKKEHELYLNRSSNSTSDLDNCLEAISSSSTSMASSRESTPERFCDRDKLLDNRNYHHHETNRNKIENTADTAKRNLDFA